ncbi:MAG: hypothetical protein JWP10_750 [Nocardioidaceae bacterium]|nr:hypothetical protein [Nocardioidaceae bacterium]
MKHVRRAFVVLVSLCMLTGVTLAATTATANAAPTPLPEQSMGAKEIVKSDHVEKFVKISRSDRLIRVAASLKGTRYRYGGTTPKGFDCSGYTRYVYKKALGKKIARTSSGQMRYRHISKSHKQRGDLIIFTHGGHAYHAAIYAGGNRIWHASKPGTRTSKTKIWSSSYVVRRP